jgi:hypothetical protein
MSLLACKDLCKNDIKSDVPSPSGKHHAVVFQRDCGATTGFSVQVSVLPAGKRLESQPGNTFSADDGHDQSVPLNVVAAWQSDESLRLEYDSRLRIFQKEADVRGIRLVYRNEATR